MKTTGPIKVNGLLLEEGRGPECVPPRPPRLGAEGRPVSEPWGPCVYLTHLSWDRRAGWGRQETPVPERVLVASGAPSTHSRS